MLLSLVSEQIKEPSDYDDLCVIEQQSASDEHFNWDRHLYVVWGDFFHRIESRQRVSGEWISRWKPENSTFSYDRNDHVSEEIVVDGRWIAVEHGIIDKAVFKDLLDHCEECVWMKN